MKIKSYLLVFILGSIVMCSCSADQNQECIPSNLRRSVIAYYPFSNGSLKDHSIYNNRLTNLNAQVAEDRFGNPNCAYRFDGTTNTYLIGNGRFTDNFHKKPFSVSLWFKATGYRDPADWEALVSRFIAPDFWSQYWSIHLHDYRLPFSTVNTVVVIDIPPKGIHDEKRHEFYSDKWIHLVVTFDGKELKLYRDGIFDNKVNIINSSKTIINEGELYVGYNYTGSIDDIIIFRKALSQDEVRQLYDMDACCD